MKATFFALIVCLLMVGCAEVVRDPLAYARFAGDLGHKALTFESPKQKNRKAIREAKNGATSLYLYGREIDHFRSLTGLTHLESLEVHHASAKHLKDFSQLVRLKNLTVLRISDSYITDLSIFKEMTNLKELDLHWNNITDISPLAGLTNLTKLNLSRNEITDLSPLAGLSNLKELNLSSNRYYDEEWKRIPEDQKEMLKKALPNCNILF